MFRLASLFVALFCVTALFSQNTELECDADFFESNSPTLFPCSPAPGCGADAASFEACYPINNPFGFREDIYSYFAPEYIFETQEGYAQSLGSVPDHCPVAQDLGEEGTPDASAGCDYFPTLSFRYSWDPERSECKKNMTVDAYFSNNYAGDTPPATHDQPKPLLVLLHGSQGSRTSCGLKKRAVAAARRGFAAIVVDYTTSSDEKWGPIEGLCSSELQRLFMIQYSMVDVRAAIRRTLFLADQTGVVDIDPTKIFVQGNSEGAVTALHLAHLNADDFIDYAQGLIPGMHPDSIPTVSFTIPDPEGSGDIEHTYEFFTSLDPENPCPGSNPNHPCNTFMDALEDGPYDIRENIRGAYCSGGAATSMANFQVHDPVPVLFSHGTCDRLVPYSAATLHDMMQWRGPDCSDEFENYNLYGPRTIYRKLMMQTASSPEAYYVLLEFCEGGHGVNFGSLQTSSPATSSSQDIELTESLRILDYEMFRMFSIVLNNGERHSDRFRFYLDEDRRSPSDCQKLADHNPSIGGNPLNFCSNESCNYGSQRLASFNPDVEAGCFQPDRYRYRADFCSDCSSFDNALVNDFCCNQEARTSVIHGPVPEDVALIEVFDFTGKLLIKTENSLEGFLKSGHGLPRGFYSIHIGREARKAVFIE
ncbi:MAG: alpha/beta hydrolase family protein [Cryomorphaceae bacterium]|nr:hypothetical protein [Flavobacteriales bacterium]